MIRSFGDRATEELYVTGKSRRFPQAVCRIGIRKLDYLNAATRLEDLKALLGNRLERLKGKYAGKHSIRINDRYRIVFRFDDGDAYDVGVTDYY